MESRLKQRLVGAIVVTLLGVIFLPMIFEDALEHDRIFENDPPPFPTRAFESGIAEMQSEVTEASKGELGKIAARPSVPVASAWALQVGSFAQVDNAKLLRDKLRKAGFPAFVEAGENQQDRLFRVLVGPTLTKDQAVGWQKELQEKLNLDGYVVNHPGS